MRISSRWSSSLVWLLSSQMVLAACGSSEGGEEATPTTPAGLDAGSATVDAKAPAAPSCTDGTKNGTESDVDCGGTCAKCTDGKACSSGADCSSGTCTSGKCETPPGAPKITSFTAAKSMVTKGKATTLTAVFENGTGTVDNSVGAITSGAAVGTGNLAAKTTFTLTVTNSAGQKATQTAVVDVADAPEITSFAPDKATVTAGKGATLTGVFKGGTGSVDKGIGAVTTGVGAATGNLAATTAYKLTVTNAAGDSVTADTSVEVVAAPVITSFVAAAAKVDRGSPGSLTGVFTGGTGAVDNGVGVVTSNVAAATGNLLSKTTFTLTVTNKAGDFVTAATDVDVKRELFVTTYDGQQLKVYAEDATGAAVPKRTIAGANTGFATPRGLSVVNDEIFVANSGKITVFNVTDNGNIAPKRTITGGNTTLSDPTQLFVVGGEIFVGNRGGGSVLVFNTADNGDVAPKRRIAGGNTLLGSPNGVAVDGGSIYVSNENGFVRKFPQNGDGNIAPTASFATIAATGMLVNGNEAFVSSPETPSRIAVYDKTTGAKLREIAGANTTLGYWSEQCTIVGVELLCTNYNGGGNNGKLLGFPIGGNGNIAPTRTITGLGGGGLGVYVY